MTRSRTLPLPLMLALGLTAACDGGRRGTGEPLVLTAEAQLRVPYPDRVQTEEGVLTRELIARGDSVFQGQAARGTCSLCHGNDLRGGPIAPDLTDGRWIRIDGSYVSIVQVVATGVPTADPPMPPLGGAPLTEQDVLAVAAYVYWMAARRTGAAGAPAVPGG